jgi:hypothetical protein
VFGAFNGSGKTSFSDAQKGAAAGFLRPISTEQIAKRLQLDQKANENGNKNLPPSDSEIFDLVEQSIVQRVESEWIWQGGEFVNNLRAYAARLASASVVADFTQLRLQADNALTRLRAAHVRAQAQLSPLKEAFHNAKSELEAFKARHRLTRAAREASHRWTTIGFATILIAIEAVLNGVFFAKGAKFGLIGGVGTAVGISLFNVVLALALGFFPARWVNYRNLVAKLFGVLFVSAGLAVLVGLHAFAAQLREATVLVGEDRATSAAIERLLSAPWAVEDVSSLYLFGLGMTFALAAMWKGYFLDDPYPGYGATTRRVEDARAEYSEEHSDLFDELEEIKEEAITAAKDGVSRIPLLPQQTAAIRAQRDAMAQNFRGYEEAVVTAANQLLAQYRALNSEFRTSPAPVRFNQGWSLPYSFLASVEVRNLLTDADPPPFDMSAALDELRQLSKAVLDEYEVLITKFPHAI